MELLLELQLVSLFDRNVPKPVFGFRSFVWQSSQTLGGCDFSVGPDAPGGVGKTPEVRLRSGGEVALECSRSCSLYSSESALFSGICGSAPRLRPKSDLKGHRNLMADSKVKRRQVAWVLRG